MYNANMVLKEERVKRKGDDRSYACNALTDEEAKGELDISAHE